MSSPLPKALAPYMPTVGALVYLLLSPGLSGCLTQHPPPNPLSRDSLPSSAESGIILLDGGYQPSGLKAAWREAGRVFVLSERTRLGPQEATPFGIRPTDMLVTAEDVSTADYQEVWQLCANFNMWLLPPFDVGILMSEASQGTFRYRQLLLFYDEDGSSRLHRGQLATGTNSALVRDHLVRSWEQGLEKLDRFLDGDRRRPVYLIREPDQPGVRVISVQPSSEPALLAELRHVRPDRRAAAAALLGHMAGVGSRSALSALFAALDAPEPDARTQFFLHDAVARYYGVGDLDREIADRLAEMADRDAADRLRRYLIDRIPGSALLLAEPAVPTRN